VALNLSLAAGWAKEKGSLCRRLESTLQSLSECDPEMLAMDGNDVLFIFSI